MTPQELKSKVLEKLQVKAAGEDAQPDDVALVSARYESLYNMLNTEGLVSWPFGSDIPDSVEIPLVTMLACHSAREFGVVGQQYAELLAEGGMALPKMSWSERQLRRIMAKKYVPTRQASEYY